ncbi:MAG: 4-hydroxy-3-methylbut-2-enyl diphosphate reductase [Clostridia bacterium]|nr:4-hydroxy-3-methylbut-2-enyl diphosphate reductase [Clostridia bacterium]
MKITVAEHAGFCFGVKRATGALEAELHRAGEHPEEHRAIYTLGRIIHNDYYIARIRAHGVREISRDDVDGVIRRADGGEAITVVIRAHGELKPILDRLEDCARRNPAFRLLDGTCPYVKKVRDIARENSGEGRVFLLLGNETHPEVEGILSCAAGEKAVFRDEEALETLVNSENSARFCEKRIAVAAQTTQKLTEWKKSINFIERDYANAKIFDTICSVTELRQEETARLAATSDCVIVIGSPDSSNSTKLYEIARARCPHTIFLTDPKEAPDAAERIRRAVPPISNLSITAGASTPFSLIQEVLAAMNENTENFAELLESSFKTLNTGEIVEGVITAITGTEIHVDLGAKTTGVIARDKATDDPQAKLEDLFKVGDTVRAKVVKVSDVDGIATLDKTRVDSESNWDKIVEACESQETLTGRITEAVKGGVIINLNSVRVFIPASLTGIPKDGDLNAIVGTDQKVKIIEIKPERKRAYASIRAVQREERKAREEAFWNNIQEGMEFDGEVKSLTDFGAFVDLGGVDGMVHTSELSWRRIRRPSDVVSVGDKIHVYVKGFDRERGRISLGYKTEEMNPWYIFTQKYQEGDTAEVKIVSLMPFGAFAEIVPGCDGLIHISQIADHKIAKPDEVLSVGDIVNAKITQIDNENHKVSLSIRQLLQEAARAAEEAAEAIAEEEPEAPAEEEAPVEEAPVEAEAPAEEAPVEAEAPAAEEEAPAAEPEAPAEAPADAE